MDLGLVNGQEPIKEANALIYWMDIVLCASYHNCNMSLKDILNEKNAEALEAKANKFFEFLPSKQREGAIFSLLSRLQNKLPPESKVSIDSKKRKHEELYAFSILNEFRSKHRKIAADSSPLNSDEVKKGSILRN